MPMTGTRGSECRTGRSGPGDGAAFAKSWGGRNSPVPLTYAILFIWHERNRYFPAVFAVAFSAVLITLQSGMLVALFRIAARPIERARADIWVASSNVPS